MEYNKFSSSIVSISTKASIKGAISPVQDFTFSNREVVHNYTHFIDERDTVEAFLPADSIISIDKKNKLFIGEDGAICDAYDLSGYSRKEIQDIIKTILITKKYQYPLYHFTIKEGAFPINVNGSHTKDGEVKIGISPNMSTHILYLTNYKEFLPKQKTLRK